MGNNRYNNTKIYKMYDPISEYYYIGSTCGTLTKRLYEHKHVAIRQPERKVYKFFNSIGWENVKIVLLEEHFLENKNQQLREENRVIEMYLHDEKCLNCLRPFVPIEEQKEHQRELIKKYYENNKEKCRIMNKKYYEENIESCKLSRQKYYQEHKEEHYQYGKHYRREHIEEYRASQRKHQMK